MCHCALNSCFLRWYFRAKVSSSFNVFVPKHRSYLLDGNESDPNGYCVRLGFRVLMTRFRRTENITGIW